MIFIATSSIITKPARLNDTLFLFSSTTLLLVKLSSFQLRDDKKAKWRSLFVLVGLNHLQASIARIDSNSRKAGNPEATSSGGGT